MLLSDVSVKRPVAALVLSMLLCVFGFVSFTKLAVREMPDIESPVVSISTRYEGASATIIESQITSVLEDQLSGISGIDEISSTTRNSMSRITITFELGYDLNTGVSDVRDAVARAQRSLPDEADDPVVYKNNGSGEASLYINLSSSEMDRTQLTDYAERVLMDRFSLISGVSSIDLSGGLYKVMYVKLKPDLMAGRSVTASDITAALRSENLESPALLYLIAELSGTKVGFLSCYCQQLLHHGGLVGEIQEMYVIPEFRSQKIGNKLLEKLIEIARKLNVLQIEVTSNAKREAAHNFYLKSGFAFTHKKFTFPL